MNNKLNADFAEINTNNNEKTKGILLMLLCATLWSIAGLFIKLIDGNGFVIAGFRGLFAGLTSLLYILFSGIPLRFNKQILKNALFMSLLFFAFVCSNKLTSAANAIVLQFTTPLWIMLYSGLFKHEKLKRRDIFAVLVTLVGITLCFLDKMEKGYLLGNFIAVFAGLMMAIMYICLGGSDDIDRINGTMWGHFITAIIGIPMLLFTKNNLSGRAYLFLIILGVVQLGIPYILLNISAKSCPPFAQSLLGAMEPLLNPVWVALFGNEIPGCKAIAGGIIVIAAVSIWCIADQKTD